MIERVLVAGDDIALDEVIASLVIRHGRQSVDDGPLASVATLALTGVTRERVSAFSVGDELELLLAADEPRFVGRITDANLTTEGLAITAVSSLARVAGRTIGAVDWPQESWRARLIRAFTEARVLVEWQEGTGTFADHDESWEALGLDGRVTLDLTDDGPQISARAAAETTLAGYLSGGFRASEDSAIGNLPDGTILVQQLTARAGKTVQELAADLVAYAPDFEQTDEVENEIELEWEGGTVQSSASGSIARFEVHPEKIATELASGIAAATAVGLRLSRRAFPRWTASPVELLELDTALGIGSPVRLHDLPEWAPASGYLGIVEGWEDRLESDDAGGLAWAMRVHLSDPRLSGGFGILWAHPTRTWATAAPATWASPGLALVD